MDMKMVAVYDLKAGAYSQPWFVPSTGAAVRAFSDVVNEKGTEPNKHPEDYLLFLIADWIPDQGIVKPIGVGPKELARALNLLVDGKE